MKYYDTKDIEYFTGTRLDVISLLPDNPEQKILEIGAGGGDTLAFIKQNNLAKEVIGFELFKIPASNQENKNIDKFIFGNIEEVEIPIEENYFDIVIMADVLEHLIDPWGAITKAEKVLKKGGKLIISVPNIRDISTFFKIYIKGDFAYNPEGGVLDKTHIRFFCKRNILNLATSDNLKPIFSCPSFKRGGGYGTKKRNAINKISLGLIEQFLAIQYLVVSEKTN